MNPPADPLEAAPTRKTNGLAITSLLLGVVGLILLAGLLGMACYPRPILAYVIPWAASITAIIFGHVASRNIRTSNGAIRGTNIAATGLFLGYFVTAVIFLSFMNQLSTPDFRRIKARKVCIVLDTAILTFRDEYGCLPLPSGKEITEGHDIEILTDSPQGAKLLTVLMGLEDDSPDMLNPKKIRFLDLAEGKSNRDGIIYTSDNRVQGLYDPWGQPYHILLDTDGDKALDNNPFDTGKQTLSERPVGTFTFGKNRKNDRGGRDDIKSW